jgi:hypothetical protein
MAYHHLHLNWSPLSLKIFILPVCRCEELIAAEKYCFSFTSSTQENVHYQNIGSVPTNLLATTLTLLHAQ